MSALVSPEASRSSCEKKFCIETDWHIKSPRCMRDLVIKNIGFYAIGLLNLAFLGAIVGAIILYCPPMPTEALVISPFIGGVVSALIILKMTPNGMNKFTSNTDYSNTSSLIGRGITMIFFAPLVYLKNHVDWTNYGDPEKAARVTEELSQWSFEEIYENFGKNRIENLQKYGFLENGEADAIKELYEKYSPIKKDYDHYKQQFDGLLQENPKLMPKTVRRGMRQFERDWREIKDGLDLTAPDYVAPDLSKMSTKIRYWFNARLGS